jgi:phosphoserine phosphatase RsbU/P
MPDDHAATVPARVDLDPWTVLAHVTDGVVVTDGDGIVGWANARAAELVAAPDGIVGWHTGEVVDRAADAGVTVRCHGAEGRVLVLRDDVEQRVADLEFLATASDQLTASLNLDRTLARLVDLAVPRLADGCVASFVEGRELRRLGAIARDGRGHVWQERGLSFRAAVPAAARVRATGVSEVHRAVDPTRLRELIPPGAAWDPLREDAPHTAMVVPLRARDASIGALVLLGVGERAPYGAHDLDLVEGFARRAALAIDNAVAYRDRSNVARLLQESLLPARLPHVAHLELGARYRPVTEGSDIGGDFYDVFPTGDGSWTVVVGDVCGKGVRAATVTGLARHTIRALATHGREPVDVLHTLNDSIRQQHDSTYCTVALARTTADERGATVEVVSGGHPPPYLLRADGAVVEVGARGTLIGALDDVRFRSRTVQLRPDDALVLYTDGVTEARVAGRQFGEGRLRRVLASSTTLSADSLAERVVQEVADYAGGVQTDDIAVVVVRARASRDA